MFDVTTKKSYHSESFSLSWDQDQEMWVLTLFCGDGTEESLHLEAHGVSELKALMACGEEENVA